MRSPVPVLAVFAFISTACQVVQVPEVPPRPNKVVMGYYASWKKAE